MTHDHFFSAALARLHEERRSRLLPTVLFAASYSVPGATKAERSWTTADALFSRAA